MLLRRVIQHVKAQNWTAVGLDFVIVVVGVFIGIQVANWNADAAQQRLLGSRLDAVQRELEENVERLDQYAARMKLTYDAATRLREILGDDPQNANVEEIDRLFILSLAVPTFILNLTAYTDLAASDEFHLLAGTPTREAMGEFDAALARLKRIEADMLNARDDALTSFLIDNHSFAAAAAHYEGDGVELAPSRFANDPVLMAEDRSLDNLLAITLLMRSIIIVHADKLAQANQELIAALEAG